MTGTSPPNILLQSCKIDEIDGRTILTAEFEFQAILPDSSLIPNAVMYAHMIEIAVRNGIMPNCICQIGTVEMQIFFV